MTTAFYVSGIKSTGPCMAHMFIPVNLLDPQLVAHTKDINISRPTQNCHFRNKWSNSPTPICATRPFEARVRKWALVEYACQFNSNIIVTHGEVCWIEIQSHSLGQSYGTSNSRQLRLTGCFKTIHTRLFCSVLFWLYIIGVLYCYILVVIYGTISILPHQFRLAALVLGLLA